MYLLLDDEELRFAPSDSRFRRDLSLYFLEIVGRNSPLEDNQVQPWLINSNHERRSCTHVWPQDNTCRGGFCLK